MIEVDVEFSEETIAALEVASVLTGIDADELIHRAVKHQLALDAVNQKNAGANKKLYSLADTALQISNLFSDFSKQLRSIEESEQECPCFLRK